MEKFVLLLVIALFQIYCSDRKNNGNQGANATLVTDTILVKGKALFVSKCASCHMVNTELTGPALKGVEDRWTDKQKLYAFIRNSQQVIKEDKYAYELWLEFNQTVMTEQNDLTDDDIKAILHYIRSVSEKAKPQ